MTNAETLAGLSGRAREMIESRDMEIKQLQAETKRLRRSLTNDLYYLRAIQRRLNEFKESLSDLGMFSLSGQAFADELDWIDAYIDAHQRKIETED